MEPKDILKQPYARRLIPQEEGGFLATIQEFPGCIADGATADEALKHLEAAAESWIEASLHLGREIPEPINMQGFSGRIALRIPRGLHKQAAEMALSEGTSINQLLITAIASYFGGKLAIRQFVAHYAQNNYVLNVQFRVQQRAETVGSAPMIQQQARTIGGPATPFRMPTFVKTLAVAESRDHG